MQVYCMINAAVTGTCGQMGGLIIQNIVKAENLQLSAAFDIVNIGKDAGVV